MDEEDNGRKGKKENKEMKTKDSRVEKLSFGTECKGSEQIK